ncbi:MAG: response regulator transcription factor [Anaerolineae bacterium]|nr:response regulator transcription factor [Anaerolineae bacterium]
MVEVSPIRIMIVDDHRAVRKGLTTLINGFDDLELVAEATNGAEAVHLCPEVQPDVILMDVMMPVMDGIEATTTIRQIYPEVRIIALTSFKDEVLIEAILQAGAVGYLPKITSVSDLVKFIRMAHRGQPLPRLL